MLHVSGLSFAVPMLHVAHCIGQSNVDSVCQSSPLWCMCNSCAHLAMCRPSLTGKLLQCHLQSLVAAVAQIAEQQACRDSGLALAKSTQYYLAAVGLLVLMSLLSGIPAMLHSASALLRECLALVKPLLLMLATSCWHVLALFEQTVARVNQPLWQVKISMASPVCVALPAVGLP